MESIACTALFDGKANTPWTRQIYTGLCELSRRGAVDVTFVEEDWNRGYGTANLVKLIVDGSLHIICDTNDGHHWVPGTLEDNLEYLAEVLLPHCDLFFKRTFRPDITSGLGPPAGKMRPLGLNYDATSLSNVIDRKQYGWKNRAKYPIRCSGRLSNLLGVTSRDTCLYTTYEQHPSALAGTDAAIAILFLVKLWDPDAPEVQTEPSVYRTALMEQRTALNELRVNCIRQCRVHFPKQFIGGVIPDDFSRKRAPDLVAPASLTRKGAYIEKMKECAIGVATTGLHESIGWKLTEYVAASRAIVSEKLLCSLPGDFREGQNYLEFATVDDLMERLDFLCGSPEVIMRMMRANQLYYLSHVRPDMLVQNVLREALALEGPTSTGVIA